jgi:protein SCO1/2
MNGPAPSKPLQTAVLGMLFVVIALIAALFARERLSATNIAKSKLPVINVLKDFSLTNQNGAVVTLADLRGKVWVGDIIFTRCPGPCRRMTKDMARLQDLWPADAPVRFVSLTTDPTNDTPAVLKRFADEFKADSARWDFLTGPKKSIVDVAVGGLLLTTVDKSETDREAANDLFIHSTIFVIVDKRGQLRASVETDNEQALTRVREIVEQLLQER